MMSTLKQKYEALSAEDRDFFLEHIRDAVYHLAECWDSLRAAESMLEGEIETDAIEPLAGGIGDPGEAYAIEESSVLEVMDGIEVD